MNSYIRTRSEMIYNRNITQMSFTEQYATYKDYVEQEIIRLHFAKEEPAHLYAPMDYILHLGGKRLRPVMTLAAAEYTGGDWKMAVSAALGVELFHNFSLVHDDIMDQATLRRGQPTVHHKWNPNIALLSGDLMLVKSYELVTSVPSARLAAMLKAFSETAAQVCEGQQMDMSFENRQDVSVGEYMIMIRYKTAVLLGCAMQLGALAAGSNDVTARKLYNFGVLIGTAFQIKDDWLDTFGEHDKVGKKPYGDIIQAKKTYLYLKALELAMPDDRKALQELYALPDGNQRVEKTLEIFNKYHISAVAQDEFRKLYQESVDIIAHTELASGGREFFTDFAEYLVERDF